MDQFSGGNWSMIPNVQAQGNFGTPANHEQLFLQQQQQQQFHHQQQQQPQQQQQQFQPPQPQPEVQQFQQFQMHQHFIQQQQFQQQQRLLQSPPSQPSSLQSPPTVVHTPQSMMHTPQQQQLVQTPQQHQSLASHFHLLSLVEKLSDTIENGTRDQNSDALVTELNSHFDKCQQLLNSISGSLGSKTMTVDGQKRNLEESELLLQLRRDLIVDYRKSIEELVKSEP